jgi:hypothetical protein
VPPVPPAMSCTCDHDEERHIEMVPHNQIGQTTAKGLAVCRDCECIYAYNIQHRDGSPLTEDDLYPMLVANVLLPIGSLGPRPTSEPTPR